MIDGLGPQARVLLDAARAGLSPDAAAVRRVRARLGATTAAGGAAAGAGAAIGFKLAVVTAAILAAAGAGLVLRRDQPAARAPRLELASAPEPPRQVAVREPAAPPPSDADLITIEAPAPVARSRRAAVELGRPVVTPGVASLRTPPALVAAGA
ncbi:MAG TPA: hypothetical protein VH165_29770, partial [Kofleriaceae bacterium]|nr:hypothetical protein [Kofleriaceae bacterium]